MRIENYKYSISISKDNQFTLFSVDNKPYDFIYYMSNYNRNSFICAYGIDILVDSETHCTIALIGRPYGNIEHCAVISDDTLIVLVDEWLAFLDLTTLQLINKVEVLSMGTGIALYNFDGGYLVHGEIEIIKTDINGTAEWAFSGRDIWVTTDNSDALLIKGDKVFLKDFLGYTYTLDQHGNEIED